MTTPDDKAIEAALFAFRATPKSKPIVDALRAAIDAYEAALWQPVATYQDGEYGLGFFPDHREIDQVLICARLEFEGDPDEPQWWHHDERLSGPIQTEPTHWRPLPSPPKDRP